MTRAALYSQFDHIRGGRRPRKRVLAKRGDAHDVRELMGQMERNWASALDYAIDAGELIAWEFEAIRLRLSYSTTKKGSKPAFYTPDFMVIYPDGTIGFDEVKGHWEEAALVRIRIVADRYPFRFRIVDSRRGGGFQVNEVIPPSKRKVKT